MKSVINYLTERALSTKAINLIDSEELTRAVRDDDLKLVKELLDKGINPNSKGTSRGDSYTYPLTEASDQGNDAIAEVLLRYGADIDISDDEGVTPLMASLRLHDMDDDIVQLLLKHNPNLEAKDESGNTLIKQLAYNNKAPMAFEYLLDKVNLNAQNDTGQTALHDAVLKNNTDIIKMLVKQGAKKNIKDSRGLTALGVAKKLNLEYYYPLLEIAISLKHSKLIDNEDIMMYSSNDKYYDRLKNILDHNANPNFMSSSKTTPLMIATIKGALKNIKLLLQYGAKKDIKNANSKTAKDFINSPDDELSALLQERSFKKAELNVGDSIEGGIYLGQYKGEDYIITPKRQEKYLKWEEAVQYCKGLELNGYSDWFLPNSNELFFAYEQFQANPNKLDFENNYYWSSEEFSNILAHHQDFTRGNRGGTLNKTIGNYVRPFRKLS